MTVVRFVVFVTFACAALAAQVPSYDLQKSKDALDKLKTRLTEFTQKEQQQLAVLEKLFANLETTAQQPATANGAKPNKHGSRQSPFTPITYLENQSQFGERYVDEIDVESVLTAFLTTYPLCVSDPNLCNAIIPSLSKILPGIELVASLTFSGNISESATQVSGKGVVDLLLYGFVVPPSDPTINPIISSVINFEFVPTVIVAYVDSAVTFSANLQKGTVDIGTSGLAILNTYDSVIEFNDTNHNGQYDNGELVSEYKLASQGWSAISVTNYPFAIVYQANTADQVVLIQCTIATVVLVDPQDNILTPNNTKCGLVINNFPFTQTGTFLALKATVSVSNGQFDVAASATVSNSVGFVPSAQSSTQIGYFSWVPFASDNSSKTFPVTASSQPLTTATTPGNIVVDVFGLISGSGTYNSQEYIFSFATGANPTFIVWDPTTGYGQPPNNQSVSNTNTNSMAVTPSASVFMSLFTLMVVLFFTSFVIIFM